MDEPSAQFQHESVLIDILWRQDVDLGVERKIFDGCLRQREEDMRARESDLKKEQELEKIMQRLQKLDKETGEFLPSPSTVNSQAVPFPETLPSTVSAQHSPVTQNPLLSALLLSKSQKLSSPEQAFSEQLSLPDLQYYLDVLESESSSLPLEDITEICHHNLPEPPQGHPSDALCGIRDLTQTIPDSFEVAHSLSCMSSDPVEALETCLQTFSDANDALSNPIYSCSTPENPVVQINPSQFCPDLTAYPISTSALVEPEQLNNVSGTGSPQSLLQFEEHHALLGFDDSPSVDSVDLETSLYAVDALSHSQSEKDELESVQSDYTDLLPLSLDTEAAEATLYESVTHSHNHSTPEYLQDKPQSNHTTAHRAAGARRSCRDEQRARALSLPISVHEIINLPVEAFNEAINSCKLSHTQNALIRDIRRRGKNKMAAQSCRKRKLDSLVGLEDEIADLKREREKSREDKERNARDLREVKESLRKLYNEVFGLLRDEHGNSYNPREYKLQHSTDGTVYLLPRTAANKTNAHTDDVPATV